MPVFFKAKSDIDCFYPQLYSFFRTNEDSDLPASQSDTCYVYWPAPSAMRQMMQRMLPPMVIPHALYGPRSRQMVRSMVGGAFKIGALQRFTDHMFGIILILGKPKSRGTLRLQSTDVSDQALIDPAYYSHPEDMETMVKGVRIARAIGGSSGLARWGAKELMPGERVKSDEAIAKYVRKNTITTYHFAGSCSMGTTRSARRGSGASPARRDWPADCGRLHDPLDPGLRPQRPEHADRLSRRKAHPRRSYLQVGMPNLNPRREWRRTARSCEETTVDSRRLR